MVSGRNGIWNDSIQTCHCVRRKTPLEIVVHVRNIAGMRNEKDVFLLRIVRQPIDYGIELGICGRSRAWRTATFCMPPLSVVRLRIGNDSVSERSLRKRRQFVGIRRRKRCRRKNRDDGRCKHKGQFIFHWYTAIPYSGQIPFFRLLLWYHSRGVTVNTPEKQNRAAVVRTGFWTSPQQVLD